MDYIDRSEEFEKWESYLGFLKWFKSDSENKILNLKWKQAELVLGLEVSTITLKKPSML